MELTLEAYRIILKYVENRADIATLCRVSQGFRRVAERALYNTLFMRNDERTILLCKTLAASSRLAMHVDALTIYSLDDDDDSSGDDVDSDTQDESPPTRTLDWVAVACVLQRTTRLRYFNVHISSFTSTAWVLEGCTFQLHKFHCDFAWDYKLVAFLDTQMELEDLYILDYSDHKDSTFQPIHLSAHAFHKLSILECTFSEAAMALIPGRPITHLKTCFSRTETTAKGEEMCDLLLKVALSTRALRSIDVADASYTETFSLEFLSAIVNMGSAVTELHHLGTLVLPVEGRKRLQFYGQLRHLPNIQSVELEVSGWNPPPSSLAALKALASEVRLYKPSVVRIIFVQDFDRTVITALDGICRANPEINTELLWREV